MIEKIYEELEKSMIDLMKNHRAFIEKGNKSAGQRARTAANTVKNLITPYKKANISKSNKTTR